MIDAFDATEPYKGGKGHQLWVLNELNNIFKHRRLNVAVGASESVNLGSYIAEYTRKTREFSGDKRPVPVMDFFVKPAERKFPLKAGDVLPVHIPDLNKQSDFGFDVAFNEAGVVEGEPIIETIHHLANLIGKIVTDFATLL